MINTIVVRERELINSEAIIHRKAIKITGIDDLIKTASLSNDIYTIENNEPPITINLINKFRKTYSDKLV